MLRSSDVGRFVTSLLPTALKAGYSHRVLLAFNAASLHDFILRSKSLDEGTIAYLLPALLYPLQDAPHSKDATVGPTYLHYTVLIFISARDLYFTLSIIPEMPAGTGSPQNCLSCHDKLRTASISSAVYQCHYIRF